VRCWASKPSKGGGRASARQNKLSRTHVLLVEALNRHRRQKPTERTLIFSAADAVIHSSLEAFRSSTDRPPRPLAFDFEGASAGKTEQARQLESR
jgi:hypothetical protein